MAPDWLHWAQRLQAIAQNGLTYSENPFDLDRFRQIRAIAIEMLTEGTNVEPGYLLNLFQQEEGYATPKVEVRGAVFWQDRILMVKEREDGCWTLPGGWIDVGEAPGRAIEREIYEESGYQTQAVKLLGVYDRNHPRHAYPPTGHHVYKLFFQCQLLSDPIEGGSNKENCETDGAEFFDEQDIPELSLARVVPSLIQRMFEHHRQPDLPTDFD
ncbi:MAG: NUDIX hydrolase [Oculatellaceae cyanobacterium Prado106]|jgi:ADP-ribose pyrophosphatase YjhB (NUDIX family)|nr:NUDIX hydrolase [Oculatellaceae cyanobacterium Prado106]